MYIYIYWHPKNGCLFVSTHASFILTLPHLIDRYFFVVVVVLFYAHIDDFFYCCLVIDELSGFNDRGSKIYICYKIRCAWFFFSLRYSTGVSSFYRHSRLLSISTKVPYLLCHIYLFTYLFINSFIL